MDERREIFRVYLELCKYGSRPIKDRNSQMLYYRYTIENVISKCSNLVQLN